MASSSSSLGLPPAAATETLERYRREAEAELTGIILPFYSRFARDATAGGFYGEIDREGHGVAGAAKGLVLNSRIVWTFARAYRLLGTPAYLELANVATDYLLRHFQDERCGGFFWTLSDRGRPLRTTKVTYGQSFAIYALAEHSMATRSGASLEAAVRTYQRLRRSSWDQSFGGYYEARRRGWRRAWHQVVSPNGRQSRKTMNTHLHLLEAYTTLYAAWKDEGLRRDLRALVEIMLHRFLAPTNGWFDQECDRTWKRLPGTSSYGHDLEAVWLLVEAAAFLGDDEIAERVGGIVPGVAGEVLAHGQGEDGALYLAGDATGPTDRTRIWWPQAEASVGFLQAYELTLDHRFLDASLAVWRFCRTHLSDPVFGEWRMAPDGEAGAPYPYKVGLWKGPYHNGRACMEIMTRAARMSSRFAGPSVPHEA